MRLTVVHVPRSLRSRLFSSSSTTPSSTTGERVIAASRTNALYGLAGVQALAATILVLSSLSGFEASLGDSHVDSLSVLGGVAGLVIAAAIYLPTRWAWSAAMVWACAVLTLQLILYAAGDSPMYAVMLLGVAQVVLLQLPEVKRALGMQPQRQS